MMVHKTRKRKKTPLLTFFSNLIGCTLLILPQDGHCGIKVYYKNTVLFILFFLFLSMGGVLRWGLILANRVHYTIALKIEQEKSYNLKLGSEHINFYLDEILRQGNSLPDSKTLKKNNGAGIHKAGLATFQNNGQHTSDINSIVPLASNLMRPAVIGMPVNGVTQNITFSCPVQGRITSHFGMRTDPVYEGSARHNGIDIAGRLWSPVASASEGTVLFAGNKPRWGNVVIIDHNESGYQTVYAHLQKTMTGKGQQVKSGQIIGLLGNTGKSTGPHLHYEVRFYGKPLNPLKFLIPPGVVVD